MPSSEVKKYHVVLLQAPAPPNDLGEMTEKELYGYIATRMDEAAAQSVLSELGQNGAAVVDFGERLGLKTRVEIRQT